MKSRFTILMTVLAALMFQVFAQEGFPPPPPPEGRGPNDMEHARKGLWTPGRGNEVLMIMSKLKKEKPEEYERLENMRKTDIRAFVNEIRKYMPAPNGNMRRMGQLDRECFELSRSICECKDAAEKAKLEEQLRAKIKEAFDFMLQDYAERLQRMTKQLEALKENEEAILDERFKMLTDTEALREKHKWMERK
ncbi:MAG: hypothetical protein IJT83_15100 [Victivallales bacterium]|nr:hypothetical protein [Victivallales bacterium]